MNNADMNYIEILVKDIKRLERENKYLKENVNELLDIITEYQNELEDLTKKHLKK